VQQGLRGELAEAVREEALGEVGFVEPERAVGGVADEPQ
jgi:hypothetical protein